MKKIYFTLLVSLLPLALFSQIVIDMAADPVTNETKNGTYYTKDINNYMGPYIGAWRYVDGNKEFRIILMKVEMDHIVIPEANVDYFSDDLTIQYQKYENDILIFDSSISKSGSIIKEFGFLYLSFTDYQRNNSIFQLELKLQPTGNNQYNNLKFFLQSFESKNTYYDEHPNEPFFSVPNNIVMTRM